MKENLLRIQRGRGESEKGREGELVKEETKRRGDYQTARLLS
jgi:hypothetical protein